MADIKFFLFDIGKVLIDFDFKIAWERIQRDSKNSIEEHRAAITVIQREASDGVIDGPVFLKQLKEILDYQKSEEALKRCWQEIFTPNMAMWDFSEKLYPHYPLYNLSNIDDLHLEYLHAQYTIFDLFKNGTYSYRAGASKPDPKIYHTAIQDLNVRPEETVFIDDLEHNVEAAKTLGFIAFQYDLHRHTDFLKWIQSLNLVPAVLA